MCQPHGAREGFPGPVPEAEAHGDGDRWAGTERGAGESHRLDSQGLASPQPLPGGSQLLGRHHRWGGEAGWVPTGGLAGEGTAAPGALASSDGCPWALVAGCCTGHMVRGGDRRTGTA